MRKTIRQLAAAKLAVGSALVSAALLACAPSQEPSVSDPAVLPTADVGQVAVAQPAATDLPTAALSEPATPLPAATESPMAEDLPAATALPVSPEGGVHMIDAEEAEAARTKFQRLLRASWDTDFSRATISFDEILTGGPPKDGIPAIDDPQFESIADANAWLDDREPVQVVDINGDARAYPVQVMVWHELVNDTVGGDPVVITF